MTQAIENSSPEQSFRQAWEAMAPGQRASKGVYSVWKTHEGDLLIAYRPEGLADDEPDQAMPVPRQAVELLILGSEGKLSPMELLTQLPKLRKLWG
jgi:hypothetical protein